jgi:hypothetical protein
MSKQFKKKTLKKLKNRIFGTIFIEDSNPGLQNQTTFCGQDQPNWKRANYFSEKRQKLAENRANLEKSEKWENSMISSTNQVKKILFTYFSHKIRF